MYELLSNQKKTQLFQYQSTVTRLCRRQSLIRLLKSTGGNTRASRGSSEGSVGVGVIGEWAPEEALDGAHLALRRQHLQGDKLTRGFTNAQYKRLSSSIGISNSL